MERLIKQVFGKITYEFFIQQPNTTTMPVNLSSSRYWAEFVKSLRDSLQISQSQFSERLDIDQATVSRWERGLCEPHYEMRKILHEIASHAGLETFENLTNTVNFSPFPMILVDRWQRIYAASMSSGFKTEQMVTHQTPTEERAFLQQFIDRLTAAGFWEGGCQKFDYEFRTEAEIRRAVVTSVEIQGEIFALVQKAW